IRVLAGITADDDSLAMLDVAQPSSRNVDPLVIEAHAVDQGLILRQAKHAGLFIAGLWSGSYGSDFDKPKAQCSHFVHIFGILVETRGQTHRIPKPKAEHLPFQVRMLKPERAFQQALA